MIKNCRFFPLGLRKKMGSQGGAVQEPKTTSSTSTIPLARQGSLYNLTLDEVHNHLGNLGKPLGSMNLGELLKSVWSAEAGGEASGLDFGGAGAFVSSLNPQGSLTLCRDLSNKTVDEVWRDMKLKKGTSRNRKPQEGETTLGEMTLEDFLVKAGVGGSSQHGHWMQHQVPSVQEQNVMGGYVAAGYAAIQPPFQVAVNLVLDAAYSETPCSLMGALSDTQTPGRKRVGDVVEKTVERRQKRMIKNRESAARSRARKQAYTQELEIKVSQLEEENERLRRLKEIERKLPSVPPPEPKHQLRRTSSAIF